MHSSSALLTRREQERDENLARVEKARAEAEAARDEAEAANHLKDEFLATLSHELRTPLTAILGWSHLLRLGNLEESARSDSVATIERNARALSSLVDGLLDMSRIITG